MKTQVAIKYVQQHGFDASETADGAVIVQIPWYCDANKTTGMDSIRCTTFRDVQIALGY